ncbi:acyl-CoA dehydrogenase family protein [Dactylosporangium roseum]|uniref:Acyl-CoA dehydrogenase family protein n=1 Tax=Dactylosporangium roseum TaxID=47989 RepID=A0ABY5YXC9_9ACTN|nr:acyl-CoA dehydrogenase family protein [Dactylosporangium roseum]UWZ34405.1 acyl-CoA dehydrogenase family protein [Dactylosporangium roseum]
MNLTVSAQRQARRREARAWLREHVPMQPLPSMDTEAGAALHRAWERTLAGSGWSVVRWPQRYGGRDYDLVDWLLFEEEYHAAGAPARINHNGLTLLGSTLLEHGTEEQRARVLPAMVAGDVVWAQAWSEPGAGSDLAGVACRADPVPGGFALHGQKIWSSRAVVADRGFGLFRSGPPGRGHRGLTYLMFTLDSPDVTVRPIRRIDGEPVFAEIFFDGLFVPESDVIGEPGHGWRIAMSAAGHERGVSLRSPGRFLAVADQLVALWRRLDEPRRLSHRYAVQTAWSMAQAYRLHGYASAAGTEPAYSASMTKPYWSELDLLLHETAMAILDDLPGATEPDRETWRQGLLFALAGPIYAGTNEIQRTIVAERLLGLPRG